MILKGLRHYSWFWVVVVLLTGCAGSYHDTMYSVHQAVQAGDYARADALLSKEKDFAEGQDRLLYFLDKGLIAHLNGAYRESNWFFEQAIQRIEELDYISITGTAVQWIISDLGQPYGGEDFERVLVHYYLTLNYLMLGELEDALVECRRLNTVLTLLNDRYEHKNLYKTDAFILYLSGLIYEALGEVNDAFIDYRNAYTTYTNDYWPNYGISAPPQLLERLVRTASVLGFSDVVDAYAGQIDPSWTTQPDSRDAARLVVIWENGFVPYKEQHIYREYLQLDDKDNNDGCYVKFAFPEFVTRSPAYNRATVTVGEKTASFDRVEDVAQIAIKNLEDRRVRMVAQSLARNALKCAAETQIKEKNEALGWVFAALTEITEQADTRSWLLLPDHIQMMEVLVPPGERNVDISFLNSWGQVIGGHTYERITFQAGQTTFLIHRTF
jgi:uncharacterized protein